MSANNYLRITKKGDKYEVTECDADTHSEFSTIGDSTNLEGAVIMANQYKLQEEFEGREIEYGLQIDI